MTGDLLSRDRQTATKQEMDSVLFTQHQLMIWCATGAGGTSGTKRVAYIHFKAVGS